MGNALMTAVQAMSNRRDYVKWKLEARLDAQGVDLAASKSVSISMMDIDGK